MTIQTATATAAKMQRRQLDEVEDRPVADGVNVEEASVVAAAAADEDLDSPAKLASGGEDEPLVTSSSPSECSKAQECAACHKLHVKALEKEQMLSSVESSPSADTGCYWNVADETDSSTTTGCLERFGVPLDMLQAIEADQTSCFFDAQTQPSVVGHVVNGELAEENGMGGTVVGSAFILLFLGCLFVLRHRIFSIIQGKLLNDDSQHGNDENRSTTDVLADFNFDMNGSSSSGRGGNSQYARET
jgi:hypothetical protein